MTLREVAAAVGYSHATLYSFFADKAALLGRLAGEAGQELADALAGQVAGGDARLALPRAAAAYLRWAVAHPHHYRLLMLEAPPPAGAEAGAADAIYALLRSLLPQRPGAGDPELRAQTLWAALHGAVLLEIVPVPLGGAPWRDLEARIAAVVALATAA